MKRERNRDPRLARAAVQRWRERNHERDILQKRLYRAIQRGSKFWTAVYTKKLEEIPTWSELN